MVVLESLVFDNLALRALPVDEERGNRIRQVAKACYSRVSPTPVKNPKLVAVSQPALQLLDLDPQEVEQLLDLLLQMLDCMTGSYVWPCRHIHFFCGAKLNTALPLGAAYMLAALVLSRSEK